MVICRMRTVSLQRGLSGKMNETVSRLANEKCFWFMYISINKAYSITTEKNLNMFLTAMTIYKNFLDPSIEKITRKSTEYQQIHLLIQTYRNRITENDIYLFQVVLEIMEDENCYEKTKCRTNEVVISEIIKMMGEEKYVEEVLLCL